MYTSEDNRVYIALFPGSINFSKVAQEEKGAMECKMCDSVYNITCMHVEHTSQLNMVCMKNVTIHHTSDHSAHVIAWVSKFNNRIVFTRNLVQSTSLEKHLNFLQRKYVGNSTIPGKISLIFRKNTSKLCPILYISSYTTCKVFSSVHALIISLPLCLSPAYELASSARLLTKNMLIAFTIKLCFVLKSA